MHLFEDVRYSTANFSSAMPRYTTGVSGKNRAPEARVPSTRTREPAARCETTLCSDSTRWQLTHLDSAPYLIPPSAATFPNPDTQSASSCNGPQAGIELSMVER